jgi:hypothetical protein
MPSARVPGTYASINIILDPPQFSLDTTFKCYRKNPKKPSLELKFVCSHVLKYLPSPHGLA